MKRIFVISMLLALVSCINQQSKTATGFAPQKSETVVEYYPEGVSPDDYVISQGIKLSVMVPEEFTYNNQQLIHNKLIQIASRGGMSAIGATPTIVIAPLFALLSQDVTATAPVKHMSKYNVTFYIANVVTGDVYSSSSLDIMGVGDSQERALQSAIESISTSDSALIKLIEDAEQRIVSYYAQNGDRIIAEAQNLALTNKYDEAIALLSSIPIECSEQYDKAQEAIAPLLEKNVIIYAERAYTQMQSCLSSTSPESFAQAMHYYQQIPNDCAIKSKADELYTTTKSTLEKSAQEELEFERASIEKAIDHDNQMEQMQLQMNIEANESLLKKYQKDAAYERLPWLRKLVHLGDYDPFDGTNETIDFNN